MAGWNGLGTFYLDPLYSPEVNGTIIDAVRYNGLTNGIAAGITASLAKNGENVPTANLPMGGYKHTGVAQATAAGQYLEYSQGVGMGVTLGVIPVLRKSAAYVVVPADKGYNITHPSTDTTARTWTIQANSTAAWTDGSALTFSNKNGAGVITIAPMDTMRLAGAGTAGNRTLATNGVATALWDATDSSWTISGTGLT
jgi:hypothetical protein